MSLKDRFNVFQSFENGKEKSVGQINFYVDYKTRNLIDFNKEKK